MSNKAALSGETPDSGVYGGRWGTIPDYPEQVHPRKEHGLARYHVGIDVGKARHHACVHDTQADIYSKVFSFSVDRPGFQGLLAFLESQAPQKEVLVGVEASGPYALTISYFLLEGGYQVVELNPGQASQFRKAQGKKAKPVLVSWLGEEGGYILLMSGIGRTALGRARPQLSEAVPPFSQRARTVAWAVSPYRQGWANKEGRCQKP
jgi:hypothetical protein